MRSDRLMWISVCLLAAGTAGAQERLSLADATARALEKNRSIRIEREGVAAAEARITAAKGAYDPQFLLQIGATHHTDPVTTIFSGAPQGEVAPTSNDFNW